MPIKICLFLTLIFVSYDAYADKQPRGYVFAELFTSQSCSSCPAADKVLQSLSKNDNVITLSCHVTYWDHLQWKDTLSKGFCTRRQKELSFKLTKSQRVYTPQLVVNGRKELIGSDKVKVIETISRQAKQPLHPLIINRGPENRIIIDFPRIKTQTYELRLFGYYNQHVQNIGAGENKGRTITYTNSVMAMTYLGLWKGHKNVETYVISRNALSGDGIVVIAQNLQTGEIGAVGRLEF